jgi:hypothetical protein
MLGYTVAGRFRIDGETINDEVAERAIEFAASVDAGKHSPWPLLYRELDDAYPGSKFILTIRDVDEWWASVLTRFGGKSTEMRAWIYGAGDPEGHEDLYKKRYEAHNAEVLGYFSNRPDDLLVFAIANGEGWDQLCPFLGIPMPSEPFPHLRPGVSDTRSLRIRSRLRKMFTTK